MSKRLVPTAEEWERLCMKYVKRLHVAEARELRLKLKLRDRPTQTLSRTEWLQVTAALAAHANLLGEKQRKSADALRWKIERGL